jgi:hypothetical protein
MPENKPTILPTARYLHQCFTYYPKTGVLRWRTRPRWHFASESTWRWWNGRFADAIAGWHDAATGYRNVSIDYRKHKTHRIIFKLMTGKEPPMQIDHKDRDTSNNRWNNLRPSTKPQQKYNSRIHKNNTSGYRGVYTTKSGKCRAVIRVHGTLCHLGMFGTPKEASTAYQAAARKLHGEFFAETQMIK